MRRTTTRPGGRPGQPGHKEQAHARQPPSRWTSVRPEGTQPLPATNSRRPDGRVCARRVPSPYRLRTAAVRMDECAPGGYPAPAGYEQPPSGWTSVRPEGTQPLPATNSRRPEGRVSAPQRRPAQQHTTRNPKHNTQSEHTGEQEPSGRGHRTHNTTHRAGAPVNRSQEAQDTAHTKQHTERAHR